MNQLKRTASVIAPVAASLAALLIVAGPASAQTVGNSGFELPALAPGGAQYNPSSAIATWTFLGNSGVTRNNSGFTSSNPNAPQGVQVAFLQRTGNFSQSIIFPSDGTVSFSFKAAQRGNSPVFPSHQSIVVTLGAAVLGVFTPTNTTYQTFSTISTAVAGAGPLTLKFAGTVANDQTAFVDNISINFIPTPPPPPTAAPEPGSLALAGSAMFSLIGATVIRRKRFARA